MKLKQMRTYGSGYLYRVKKKVLWTCVPWLERWCHIVFLWFRLFLLSIYRLLFLCSKLLLLLLLGRACCLSFPVNNGSKGKNSNTGFEFLSSPTFFPLFLFLFCFFPLRPSCIYYVKGHIYFAFYWFQFETKKRQAGWTGCWLPLPNDKERQRHTPKESKQLERDEDVSTPSLVLASQSCGRCHWRQSERVS